MELNNSYVGRRVKIKNPADTKNVNTSTIVGIEDADTYVLARHRASNGMHLAGITKGTQLYVSREILTLIPIEGEYTIWN